MPSFEFVTVDVFTDEPFSGNPVAVFPAAKGLSEAQMQAIAAEFNLSETTFVLPPADRAHTAEVRIFSPHRELSFGGHPNVGTGFVLARRLDQPVRRLTFEQKAGLVRVALLFDAAHSVTGAGIAAPRSLKVGIDVGVATIAACAGLAPEDVLENAHPPLVAGVGTDLVIAELTDMAALRRASPDTSAFRSASAAEALPTKLMLYVRLDGDATRLAVRVFAPAAGFLEEAATGSAAAAVAAVLTAIAPGDTVELAYDVVQGAEMGRPSRISVRARKEAEGPVTAHIEGSCVPVMRGFIDL